MTTTKVGLLGAVISRSEGSWKAANKEQEIIAELANEYLKAVIYVPKTTLHEMYNTGGDPNPDNTAAQILMQDLGAELLSLSPNEPIDPEVLY